MSEWTVKRDEPQQTPQQKLITYGFGVLLLGAVGAGIGAFAPYALAMGSSYRKKGESYGDYQRRQRRQEAAEETIEHDDEGSMKGRALLGFLLGACAGGVLAFKTERAARD